MSSEKYSFHDRGIPATRPPPLVQETNPTTHTHVPRDQLAFAFSIRDTNPLHCQLLQHKEDDRTCVGVGASSWMLRWWVDGVGECVPTEHFSDSSRFSLGWMDEWMNGRKLTS